MRPPVSDANEHAAVSIDCFIAARRGGYLTGSVWTAFVVKIW